MQTMQELAKENYENWTMNPMKYEIVPERGTVRLREFMKEFDEETLVKHDGAPLIMQSSGRPLRACDVYPERADLALDSDGKVLSDAEFQARYVKWLEAWVMEGDAIAEVIPNPIRFISEVHDEFSESVGMVEAYFDPKTGETVEPSEMYDSQGRKRGEEGFDGDKSGGDDSVSVMLMKAMVDKLDPEQLAEILQKQTGAQVVGGEGEEDQAPTADTEVKMWSAPCGEEMRLTKKGSHKRYCKDEACNPSEESAKE